MTQNQVSRLIYYVIGFVPGCNDTLILTFQFPVLLLTLHLLSLLRNLLLRSNSRISQMDVKSLNFRDLPDQHF